MTVQTIVAQTNIINNNNLPQRLFYLMFGVCIVLSFVYVYLIGSIIFNVLERKSVENQVRTIRSAVGNLELDYLSQNKTVDLSYAKSLGFEEPKNLYFASRKSLVTLRNEE
ncbi:MAG: hypothetical protein WC795_01990 [Candidatus Paceibacterota bacterium]|jgi:hypothetical protein